MDHEMKKCDAYAPEVGSGILPPCGRIEALFNAVADKMVLFAAILLFINVILINIDVAGRQFFSLPLYGFSDFEGIGMCMVGFISMAMPIVLRQSMQIDLLYNVLGSRWKRFFALLSLLLALIAGGYVGYQAMVKGMIYESSTMLLEIPEGPIVVATGVLLLIASLAVFFQIVHIARHILQLKEFCAIALALALAALLTSLPFLIKSTGVSLSPIMVGIAGFCLLMLLIMVRVPIGYAMSFVGILGLFTLMNRPAAVGGLISTIPYTNLTSAIIMAFPVFMMMGEMVGLSGLSDDLFRAAQMWLGRAPGGLAMAAVGGCAGFGAVCGESLATVITMSSVALPAMDRYGYDKQLSTGALAAGGTLGILIPPSMGFIVYSMITEVSVGKLFIAGILPGVLLCSIFMAIIWVKCMLNPSLAPRAEKYPLSEKLNALAGLVPVVLLFTVVVLGILRGWFTPAEGGAVGAFLAMIYAGARGKLTLKNLERTLHSSALTFGKMFALFVGLYVFNAFLSYSRLPNLLAEAVASMNINRYTVLAAVIGLYILLGCVMNIMPIMTLTLPSIYPTVEMMGFDMVWFGVVCVIIMEMGQITPPVGLNVFTLAGMRSDIPMSTIYKGVMPFFFGMILCVLLLILFPSIPLYLLQ